MKKMKLNKVLFALMLLLIASKLFSASLPIEIDGDYQIRLPDSGRYVSDKSGKFPDNVIITIPNKNIASTTFLILDGHKVRLYSGASFKISKGSFIPLIGRFEFSSDDEDLNTINIIANNCNAAYTFGHFLIEVTPDNGVFFAMKSKGSAWVKDVYRKVYELKPGQQVQVPLYGSSVSRNHVESFWGKNPSSFGNLGEVGQETAYGIVGKNPGNSLKKPDKASSESDEAGEETAEEDNDKDSSSEDTD